MYKFFVLIICLFMVFSCVSQSGVKPIQVGDDGILEVELEDYADQATFAPFSVIDDPEASGGKAIVWLEEEGIDEHVADPYNDTPGQVQIAFTLPTAADAAFSIQVNMENADDDSFYYQMDSEGWNIQNNITTSGYETIDVMDFFDLAAGDHVFKILRRENGSILDKATLTFTFLE